jgi:hypothetical protein
MYNPCPKCKSKNIKCLETKIDELKCKCLDCGEEFITQPTRQMTEEFNG